MGARLDATAALDAAFHMHTYARKPVMFVAGSGMRLTDDTGREYLDFVSGIGAVNLGHSHPAVVEAVREYLDFVAGIGAVNLGHSHPAVVEAVREQVGKLTHVSNLYHVEHRAELAQELVALFGGGARVFFGNSGAEAVEGAIKLARKWGKSQRGPGCFRIVSAERSFHGRTLAALTATGQSGKQEAFLPLPDGFDHVPLNDIDALEMAVADDTCAVLIEPVQGEGGVYPCDPEYLRAVRQLCDERGVLLILDEIQTGFYRTGPAFGHEVYGVKPDVMCLAKSLANGLPIGALLARNDVADVLVPGDHGSTFGGGPVVCAAARACVAALADERLGENAAATGAYLRERMTALASSTGTICDVRGIGLMNAIQFKEPIAVETASLLLEAGFIVNHIGTDILRMLPPLMCGTAEVDALAAALADVLDRVTGEVA